MSRAALLLLLVAALMSAVVAHRPMGKASAQEATPDLAADLLVGAWIVRELAPPNGGPPATAGVMTILADGNVLLSGFGDGLAPMQGAWSATGDRAAPLTVVGLVTDASGSSDGTLRRVRAAIALNAAGDAWQGGYTFDLISPDGGVQFTYNGPVDGARVRVEPPDPVALTLRPATPAVATPVP